MDELIRQASRQGVQEVVIGMVHCGRLNVLVNTLGKMPAMLFAEFEHTAPQDLPAGDVKYHQGFRSDIMTPHGPIHLMLTYMDYINRNLIDLIKAIILTLPLPSFSESVRSFPRRLTSKV